MTNGAVLNANQAAEMWEIIDEALERQQRNPAEAPILTNDWQHRRGRLSIIPGGVGQDNQSNGDRLIRMINEDLSLATLNNGARLHARWNHQLPRVARLTIRAGSRGDPQELIESETLGVARLNRWPAHLRNGVRFTGTIPSDDPNYRLIRFEASPEVVAPAAVTYAAGAVPMAAAAPSREAVLTTAKLNPGHADCHWTKLCLQRLYLHFPA